MFYRIVHYTMRLSLFLLFIITLLDSCAKLPINKSYWEYSNKMNSSVYSGYQKETNIRWTVGNDTKYLYLNLETDNRAVTRSIMMRGLTIYFDATGKKHKSIYFQYPYRAGFNRTSRDMNHQNFAAHQHQFNRNQRRKFRSPTRAYWKNGIESMVLNTAMERSDFKYSMKIDTMGYITYKVAIPLNEIAMQGYKNIQKLSIGIVTSPRPNRQFNRSFSGRFRGGYGGGDGGFGGTRGRFGGGRGFGGYRGRFNGAQSRSGGFSPTNIKIWFLTHLSQKPIG